VKNLKNRSIERTASLARINLVKIKVLDYTLTTTVLRFATIKATFYFGFEHVLNFCLNSFQNNHKNPPPQEQLEAIGDNHKK
jgi:hypothetical protein